jgi:hypothetical protein
MILQKKLRKLAETTKKVNVYLYRIYIGGYFTPLIPLSTFPASFMIYSDFHNFFVIYTFSSQEAL